MLIVALCCVRAQAELVDVLTHAGEQSDNLEIIFSTPMELQGPLAVVSPTELLLTLGPLAARDYRGWSSSRLDVDEKGSRVTTVTLEGSRSAGVELRITFDKPIHAELLPQYTKSHVLLAITTQAKHRAIAKKPKPTNAGRCKGQGAGQMGIEPGVKEYRRTRAE